MNGLLETLQAKAALAAGVMMYDSQVAALGAMMARAGLCPVVIKGKALTDTVYPADHFRLAADVDLLVGAGEVDRVVTCLLAHGFVEKGAQVDRTRPRCWASVCSWGPSRG